MAFSIMFRSDGKEIKKEYEKNVRLKDVIAESGISFDLPCGGRGVCGNCKVFASGTLSEPTDEEIAFLGESLKSGARLACAVEVFGDAEIEIPTRFISENFDKCKVSVEIKPITGGKQCFACAVDIGTTTILFRYYSLPDGQVLLSEHIPNPQRVRGADVLTRIDYASNGGLNELKEMIDSEIKKSALRFGKDIEFYVITGNTAMLHILSGKETNGLATAPFKPETLFGFWDGNRYFMRCASAYIGSDVIAALLASGITESETQAALLDIGTNSECILWDGKKVFACSSPAGPAFEGANISCGIAASQGAICNVEDKDGQPEIHTVDGKEKPRGFCGSGLIDAIAFLLKNGYIAKDGSVTKELPDFGGIKLTAQDIAELQLAKSAVCAGFLTLCEVAGIFPKRLYLTGSFGNKLNPDNAEFIGLIPKGTAKNCRTSICGAIDGASMVLLNGDVLRRSEELAEMVESIELADSEFFEKTFIENMYFC